MKKQKSEFKNLVEQTKKREKIKKEQVDKKWIITIIIISFSISFILSFIANLTIPNFNIYIGIIITLFFIGIIVVNIIVSPLFQSKEYYNRIKILYSLKLYKYYLKA